MFWFIFPYPSPLWTPCYTERFSSVPTMFRLDRFYCRYSFWCWFRISGLFCMKTKFWWSKSLSSKAFWRIVQNISIHIWATIILMTSLDAVFDGLKFGIRYFVLSSRFQVANGEVRRRGWWVRVLKHPVCYKNEIVLQLRSAR